jgi:hypothetical protein
MRSAASALTAACDDRRVSNHITLVAIDDFILNPRQWRCHSSILRNRDRRVNVRHDDAKMFDAMICKYPTQRFIGVEQHASRISAVLVQDGL